MKKILFLCTTSFQLMMAVSFRLLLFKDDEVDVIISDLINGSEQLQRNVRCTGFFNKTYYLRNYKFDYKTSGKCESICKILLRRKKVKSLIMPLDKYDSMFVSDSLPSINAIYEILYNRNKNMELFFYEEGPVSVLCDQGKHFNEKNKGTSKKWRIVSKLLGVKSVDGNYVAAYSSVAELMDKNYFEWRSIPIVKNEEIKHYIEILNKFWDYKGAGELSNKIVFLEESFFQDNRGDKDIEIITDIINHSFNRQVIVKLHPRTRVNRFSGMGISTYTNFGVPWELIALNGDLENAMLICVGSGAILYPKLYWGIDQKSIALVNCNEYRFDYLNNEYYDTFSKVCKEKNLAKLPSNKEEFFAFLEDFCNDTK